jgi:hypothetical protein
MFLVTSLYNTSNIGKHLLEGKHYAGCPVTLCCKIISFINMLNIFSSYRFQSLKMDLIDAFGYYLEI